MNAIDLAIIMFILVLVGCVCRKLKIVDEHFGASLSKFIFNIVFPAIIIISMNIEFKKSDLYNSIVLVIISIVTMGIMFTLGLIVNKSTRKKDSISKIVTFAMMFPNYTFMAFPIMETLFPEKGLFYVSMYTIPVRILIYIAGPLLMRPNSGDLSKKQLIKQGLKSLLTPPVLAIPVGLLLYFFGITLPIPIHETLAHFAKVATPMGMVVSGIMLAEAPIKKIFGEKRIYLLTILRLVIAPVLMYFILLPFNLDPIIFKIAVLYCALPIASSTTIFALQYNGDATNAAGSVFITTVISMITVPTCAYLINLLII